MKVDFLASSMRVENEAEEKNYRSKCVCKYVKNRPSVIEDPYMQL